MKIRDENADALVKRLRSLADRVEGGEAVPVILAFIEQGTLTDVTMAADNSETTVLMLALLQGLEKRGMAAKVGPIPFMGKPAANDVN